MTAHSAHYVRLYFSDLCVSLNGYHAQASCGKLVCCCAGHFATILADLQSTDPQRLKDAGFEVSRLPLGAQQDAIIAASALPLLVPLLRSGQPNVQEATAITLERLADRSEQMTHAIIKAGVVPLLVAWLRSGQPNMHEIAAKSLERLAAHSEQITHAIIKAGALHLLVPLLRSGQPNMQQQQQELWDV